jgi:ABC-type Na+ transport system ATPase subunit NatA
LVRDLIERRKRAGKAVLFSSHTLSEVEKVADRILIINKGRKLFEGTVDALLSSTSVGTFEEAYESVLAGKVPLRC